MQRSQTVRTLSPKPTSVLMRFCYILLVLLHPANGAHRFVTKSVFQSISFCFNASISLGKQFRLTLVTGWYRTPPCFQETTQTKELRPVDDIVITSWQARDSLNVLQKRFFNEFSPYVRGIALRLRIIPSTAFSPRTWHFCSTLYYRDSEICHSTTFCKQGRHERRKGVRRAYSDRRKFNGGHVCKLMIWKEPWRF